MQPLFPASVDGAESVVQRRNGSEPTLPPGGTSGVIPGLEQAVAAILRNYNPGDIGICEIADKISLSLPVPDWASYCWTEEVDAVWAGAATGNQLIYTVPADERNTLVSWCSHRAAGDNTFSILRITAPAGYGAGSRVVDLMAMAAGSTRIYWPDPGGNQTIPGNSLANPAMLPLLLEPGTILEILADAAGVAATTITSQIMLIRSKVVRALIP